MIRVNCDTTSCLHNTVGICSKDEISLSLQDGFVKNGMHISILNCNDTNYKEEYID